MTEHDPVIQLLRAGLPKVADVAPDRDVWPIVVSRGRAVTWSWFDISVAALVGTVLVMFPDWGMFLAFHL